MDLVARNENTIKDNTLLPNQEEIRNRVALYKFRSKIDLSDSYYNIKVNLDYEKYTSFSILFGQFRTRIIQQGDYNVSAIMVKAMSHILRPMLRKSVTIYLDNIFIYFHTWEQHKKELRQLHTILKKNKFYINKSKSPVNLRVMQILRVILTEKGLEIDSSKVELISMLPIPKNRKELQEFNGMVIYLSQFLPKLTDIIALLTKLAGAIKDLLWIPLHTESFNQIKKLLDLPAILKLLDYESTDPLFLICDVSQVGVEGWIGQGSTLK